ncbi:hypothetical protein B0H63DRAFT_560815 [Podospora didyma]|uniref:F-box domain-containing protein n=1 Tax=Podospora didyma TaxID=330526 RepID=A0AAE0TVM5_9PEZI|nr:hypothetical protein B0H63DRAFT_560815 [Podospora didyma]
MVPVPKEDMIQLTMLPVELVALVIAEVDPVELIALSQTCRSLRGIIRPTRWHFMQRLLALELDPAVGGITPLFRGRDNKLTPQFSDDWEAWKINKYACCGCMKLLPHTMFDNHNILRLHLRKPPPSSDEATKKAEWTLSGKVPSQNLSPDDRAALKAWGLQYHRAVNKQDDSDGSDVNGAQGPAAFLQHDVTELDRLAEEAEMHICGRARHRRRCNECRWQKGDWKSGRRLPPLMRRVLLPIVPTRHSFAPDAFSRWYPGLLPRLRPEELPHLGMPTKPANKTARVQMYTVRCISCSVWQELAAFLPSSGLHYDRWQRPRNLFPDGCCHRCTCNRVGRAAFSNTINLYAISIAKRLRDNYARDCLSFWDPDDREYPWQASMPHWVRYKTARATIRGDMPELSVSSHGIWQFVEFMENANRDDLRHRTRQLREFIKENITPKEQQDVLLRWNRFRIAEYELNEALYFRYRDVIKRIENDPDWLVDYVLDPAAFRADAGLLAFRGTEVMGVLISVMVPTGLLATAVLASSAAHNSLTPPALAHPLDQNVVPSPYADQGILHMAAATPASVVDVERLHIGIRSTLDHLSNGSIIKS